MAPQDANKADQKPVDDLPTITESQWYTLAITTAIFTGVAIVGAFAFIFGDGFDDDRDLKIAQALAPFGVALFAVVTFCTAGWRGSINTRQANQAEREGRAKLLQEGAKLLGEKENPSHVSAGVATLELLITGPDSKLAVQAMNLIADYIQNEMGASHQHRFREETFAALASGAKLGREANRTVKFSAPEFPEEGGSVDWHSLAGVKRVQYSGGKIEAGVFGDFNDSEKFSYAKVALYFLESVKISYRFHDCQFQYCDISSYREKYSRRADPDTFKQCDFSRCNFGGAEEIPDFRAGKNYFRAGKEPVANNVAGIDWTNYLIKREKGDF